MISLTHLINEDHLDIGDNNIRYHKSSKTFTADMSDLKQALRYRHSMKEPITLFNSKTGKSMVFKFVKMDYAGSGEDKELTGWEFKSREGIKFIIFNE